MPANGWAMPQTMFWTASANPNTSRPQSFACDCGLRKRPRTARGPKLKNETRQPQSTITAGVRQLVDRCAAKGKELAIGGFSNLRGTHLGTCATAPNQNLARASLIHAWQLFS